MFKKEKQGSDCRGDIRERTFVLLLYFVYFSCYYRRHFFDSFRGVFIEELLGGESNENRSSKKPEVFIGYSQVRFQNERHR